MRPELPIADCVVFPLGAAEGVLTLLRDDQNLLRRFGAAELVRVAGVDYRLRQTADELVTVMRGAARLQLADTRVASPSFGARLELELASESPQLVVIPFGVAYTWQAAGECEFLRFMTHTVGADESDVNLTAAELLKGLEAAGE